MIARAISASKLILLCHALACLLPFLAPRAEANTYTWDPAKDHSGSGGNGTWNTTTAVWWSGSGSDVKFPDSSGSMTNTAFFGGSGGGGNVTVSGVVYANQLWFNTDGYTLSSGTVTLGGTSPDIDVVTGTATISSVLAGTAA